MRRVPRVWGVVGWVSRVCNRNPHRQLLLIPKRQPKEERKKKRLCRTSLRGTDKCCHHQRPIEVEDRVFSLIVTCKPAIGSSNFFISKLRAVTIWQELERTPTSKFNATTQTSTPTGRVIHPGALWPSRLQSSEIKENFFSLVQPEHHHHGCTQRRQFGPVVLAPRVGSIDGSHSAEPPCWGVDA